MNDYKDLIILIAEDDDGHAMLINEGLRESGVCNTIIRFKNGLETWQFLVGKSETENLNNTKSYLLLLDINMPLMDGIELLQKIKADAKLKDIPVIMLTTTDDPREVKTCYKYGCNMYITKPIQFDKFAEMLNRMGLFIQIVKVIN